MTDYLWVDSENVHADRAKAILRAHPEVSQLMGYDWINKYIALIPLIIQLTIAFNADVLLSTWYMFVLCGGVIGGTCVHMLTLAIHELSHNLFFKSPRANCWFSYLCNLPIIVPYAASFKEYHMDHHRSLGVDQIDTDIPTEWEGKTFNTTFMKFLWVLFQPVFYAVRPLVVNPKPLKMENYINLAIQLTFIYVLYMCSGLLGVFYCICSTWWGLGIHPCAGHFIAEHYVGIFSYGHETISYRGILNMISFNVGFHCEHHDFANISNRQLPQLSKLAPEFYDTLPLCISWPLTTYIFITNPNITPFNRIKRSKVHSQ
jgi:sphingolipid delta-4 desaturase